MTRLLLLLHGAAACAGAVRPDASVPDGTSPDVPRVDALDTVLESGPQDAMDILVAPDAATDVSADLVAPADVVCRSISDAGDGAVPAPIACSDTSCAVGERCNSWTGRCQPAAAPFPPPGGDVGAACVGDSDCRSAGGLGAATIGVGVCESPGAGRWPGGYCRSYCNLCPDSTSVWDVASLGRSNCPQGAVCLPVFYAQGGGYGACMRECRVDSDCRTSEGYYCRRTIGSRTYPNGYCAPAHCQSRGCPASYECFC